VKIVPPQHTKMVPHQTLYLNNCAAGCDIKIGSPDANTNTTDIGRIRDAARATGQGFRRLL